MDEKVRGKQVTNTADRVCVCILQGNAIVLCHLGDLEFMLGGHEDWI